MDLVVSVEKVGKKKVVDMGWESVRLKPKNFSKSENVEVKAGMEALLKHGKILVKLNQLQWRNHLLKF